MDMASRGRELANVVNVMMMVVVWCGSVAVVPPINAAAPTEKMNLWKQVNLPEDGGMFPCLGDLTNNGQVDFFLYRQGPRTTPGYLAAIDHDGTVLWSRGDASISSHQPDGDYNEPALRGIALVYDIDQDDRSEVITELWKEDRPMLCVLDGRTGAVERSRPSPFDLKVRGGRRSRCHPLARIAYLEGESGPPFLVLKYEASGRVPTHAVALDGSLQTVWRVRGEPDDMGHLPTVADIDGDGKDEVLLGNLLVDSDGERLWRCSAQNHADCTAVFQPAAGAEQAALISIRNSGPAFCLSPAGETPWQKSRGEVSHGQGIWAGNFIEERPGPEVIIFTQSDSQGAAKEYLPQDNAYNIHGYF